LTIARPAVSIPVCLSKNRRPLVGDYDFNIERCRQWRAEAVQELRELESGPHWFRNGEDVTDEIIERTQRIIAEMDILIAAYESHNA